MKIYMAQMCDGEWLGITEIGIIEPDEVGAECGACDRMPKAGEVVGWFDDGYQSAQLFCSSDIMAPFSELEEVVFYPSREYAWEAIGSG